ncbi:MAG: type II secretion system F family protein [Faecalibacterium sp.]
MFNKKEKTPKSKPEKVIEPQYYRSATNIQTLNYHVYYMSTAEKIVYYILGFAVGAAVGYLFYGGIAKNEYGDPTTLTYIINTIVSVSVGLVTGKVFLPIRTEQILQKRQRQLRTQFRDMLEALSTSMSAGKNVVDSFDSIYYDMSMQYGESAFIIQELKVINNGLANGVNIEELLADFGARSASEDIVGFANVFEVCYRKGGNIKDTVRSTYDILSEKMAISEDIATVVSGSKSQQYIMLLLPIMMIVMIKSMSADFAANFVTLAGIGATTVAIGLFVISYFVGKVMLNIKV